MFNYQLDTKGDQLGSHAGPDRTMGNEAFKRPQGIDRVRFWTEIAGQECSREMLGHGNNEQCSRVLAYTKVQVITAHMFKAKGFCDHI